MLRICTVDRVMAPLLYNMEFILAEETERNVDEDCEGACASGP
jgi:hypothetical protein